MNKRSLPHDDSTPSSTSKKTKQTRFKDLIKVKLFTKSENDEKDETDTANWNECEVRILNPGSDEQDECTQEDEIVKVVSHVKDFDTVKYSHEDDESEQENSTPHSKIPDRIRLGIHIRNDSDYDLSAGITIDDKPINQFLLNQNNEIFVHKKIVETSIFPLFIRRHELANDESEVDRPLISKLGIIKIELSRVNILDTYSNTSSLKEHTVNNREVKIKSSMVKDSSMSLEFGAEKKLPSTRITKVSTMNKLVEYNIKYRNYTGYLLEIVRAELTIDQIKSQIKQPPLENDKEFIDISDGEDETPSLPPPPPLISNSTPPKSLTIMEKITEKANEIESKDVEELSKYIKLKDEPLYHNIHKIFKREGIDGVSFLLLTVETMQPMKLRIGDQVKIKQIVQQIKENTGW